MKTQNQIKRKLSEPTSIEYVRQVLVSREIPLRRLSPDLVVGIEDLLRVHDNEHGLLPFRSEAQNQARKASCSGMSR